MPHLIWSRRARADLKRVDDFLRTKNPQAANRALAAIQEGVRLLRQFPDAGRPAEQYGNGRREWFIRFGDGGYLILYRHFGDDIAVAALRHSREANYQP